MKMEAPLILTATEKIEAAEAYIKSEIITTGKVLGSDSLISNKAVKDIFY